MKETTHRYLKPYRLRFRYFEWSEKITEKNRSHEGSIIGSDRICGGRITRLWWKPFYWLGNRRWLRSRWSWWVRTHLTFD